MIRPIHWPSLVVARCSTLYWGRVATHAYARALAKSIALQVRA